VQTKLQPLEAPLIPRTNFKLIRPPMPGEFALKSIPSSAPAPRLRPSAPREAAIIQEQAAPNAAPLSAADEIAGMFSPNRSPESADAQASFDSRSLSASAPIGFSQKNKSGGVSDPFFFRRTIIPILLTIGIIMAGWATLLITCGQNNALADLFPGWTPIALLIFALIFLALAAFNILSIKNAK